MQRSEIRTRIGSIAVAVWGGMLTPMSAWAQSTSEAASETTIPGGTLMIVSYMVFWGMLLAFAGYLSWRQKQLSSELDSLEDRLDEIVDRAVDVTSDSDEIDS